jgi:hypothetical protein
MMVTRSRWRKTAYPLELIDRVPPANEINARRSA